jgi:hypothetical protein
MLKAGKHKVAPRAEAISTRAKIVGEWVRQPQEELHSEQRQPTRMGEAINIPEEIVAGRIKAVKPVAEDNRRERAGNNPVPELSKPEREAGENIRVKR